MPSHFPSLSIRCSRLRGCNERDLLSPGEESCRVRASFGLQPARIGRRPGRAAACACAGGRTCSGACLWLRPPPSCFFDHRAERSSAAGGVWCLLACGGREEAAQIGARGGAFARLLRRPPGRGRDECFSRASRLPGCYRLPDGGFLAARSAASAGVQTLVAARAPPPSSIPPATKGTWIYIKRGGATWLQRHSKRGRGRSVKRLPLSTRRR